MASERNELRHQIALGIAHLVEIADTATMRIQRVPNFVCSRYRSD